MDRRTVIQTGSVVAGGLVAGCVGRVRSVLDDEPAIEGPCDAPGGPWPTAGGDPGRTGRADTDPPGRDAEGVDLLAGRRDDGGKRLAASLPAVVDRTAYVPTGSELAAIDLDTPADGIVWVHEADDDIDAVPAVACGAVLVPGLNHLAALDPETGDAYWRADVGGYGETTIGARGERAYVAGVNPTAVDVRTGDIRWSGAGGDTIAVGENSVYTTRNANGTGGVFAHDHDGDERWRLALGKIVASATVEGGTVWVPDTNGTVYAIDAATGETYWSRGLEGVAKVHSGLAVRGDDVAVPAGTGRTSVVLDGTTGERRWRVDTGIVTGRPIIGDDWIAFGRTNTGVTVYDRDTGEERVTWSREEYDFGTIDGVVPVDDGFIVRGGTTSGLTLLR